MQRKMVFGSSISHPIRNSPFLLIVDSLKLAYKMPFIFIMGNTDDIRSHEPLDWCDHISLFARM